MDVFGVKATWTKNWNDFATTSKELFNNIGEIVNAIGIARHKYARCNPHTMKQCSPDASNTEPCIYNPPTWHDSYLDLDTKDGWHRALLYADKVTRVKPPCCAKYSDENNTLSCTRVLQNMWTQRAMLFPTPRRDLLAHRQSHKADCATLRCLIAVCLGADDGLDGYERVCLCVKDPTCD